MKPGKRFGLSAEQKCDVWRRWKAGQTLHEIGRAFGKEHSSIRCLVSRHGGIAPAIRRRALLGGWLPVRRSVSLASNALPATRCSSAEYASSQPENGSANYRLQALEMGAKRPS